MAGKVAWDRQLRDKSFTVPADGPALGAAVLLGSARPQTPKHQNPAVEALPGAKSKARERKELWERGGAPDSTCFTAGQPVPRDL